MQQDGTKGLDLPSRLITTETLDKIYKTTAFKTFEPRQQRPVISERWGRMGLTVVPAYCLQGTPGHSAARSLSELRRWTSVSRELKGVSQGPELRGQSIQDDGAHRELWRCTEGFPEVFSWALPMHVFQRNYPGLGKESFRGKNRAGHSCCSSQSGKTHNSQGVSGEVGKISLRLNNTLVLPNKA